MKDNRPVNLEINTIRLPVTAYASILHRISGVAVFFGVAILLYLLDKSLQSHAGFEKTLLLLDGWIVKILVWLVLCGLIYHTMAGVRHLIMDMGVGESLEGGRKGAIIVIAGSIILMLLAGVWLW